MRSIKVLAIDCGNSRLKFALAAGGQNAVETMLAHEKLSALGDVFAALIDQYGQPDRIVVSNVAGAAIGNRVAEFLRVFAADARWLVAQSSQCGVVNRYDNPAQLGSDRWAALIGAWCLQRDACLVVNAGTATTVDALSASGEFLGGMILPGLDMMRTSLATGTAALPVAAGVPAQFPRNTADAIWSGCVAAQAGAIWQMWTRLPDGATCLLSGGAAQALSPALTMPRLLVDNLVLHGLLRIAQEEE